jgi:predicted nucleic acid-binding protein
MAEIGHLVISPLVLAELDYLVTKFLGTGPAIQVLGHLADRVSVARFEVADVRGGLHSARQVMRQYSALDIGLTNAMNVVVAREIRTDAVFTVGQCGR